MDVKLDWKQGMSFNGSSDNDWGFNIPLGTSAEFGGKNDGFKPLELILIGLAGCTAMDVVSILEKKRQVVSSFQIKVHADRAAEHPKVFTDVVLEYIFSGKELDPVAVDRAVELSDTKYCSAMAMLRKNSPIHTKITINQE
ncbi:MAG: OsmC family protein [Anaerolineae bacterium]|nr:OsmC family protein [Anaerolineae bacterium]